MAELVVDFDVGPLKVTKLEHVAVNESTLVSLLQVVWGGALDELLAKQSELHATVKDAALLRALVEYAVTLAHLPVADPCFELIERRACHLRECVLLHLVRELTDDARLDVGDETDRLELRAQRVDADTAQLPAFVAAHSLACFMETLMQPLSEMDEKMAEDPLSPRGGAVGVGVPQVAGVAFSRAFANAFLRLTISATKSERFAASIDVDALLADFVKRRDVNAIMPAQPCIDLLLFGGAGRRARQAEMSAIGAWVQRHVKKFDFLCVFAKCAKPEATELRKGAAEQLKKMSVTVALVATDSSGPDGAKATSVHCKVPMQRLKNWNKAEMERNKDLTNPKSVYFAHVLVPTFCDEVGEADQEPVKMQDVEEEKKDAGPARRGGPRGAGRGVVVVAPSVDMKKSKKKSKKRKIKLVIECRVVEPESELDSDEKEAVPSPALKDVSPPVSAAAELVSGAVVDGRDVGAEAASSTTRSKPARKSTVFSAKVNLLVTGEPLLAVCPVLVPLPKVLLKKAKVAGVVEAGASAPSAASKKGGSEATSWCVALEDASVHLVQSLIGAPNDLLCVLPSDQHVRHIVAPINRLAL